MSEFVRGTPNPTDEPTMRESADAVTAFQVAHPDAVAEYELRNILHFAIHCDRATWESYRGVIRKSAERGLEAQSLEGAVATARLAGRVAGLEEAATIADKAYNGRNSRTGFMVDGAPQALIDLHCVRKDIRARLGDTGTLASRNGEIALEVPEIRENTREKLDERPLGDTGNQEEQK